MEPNPDVIFSVRFEWRDIFALIGWLTNLIVAIIGVRLAILGNRIAQKQDKILDDQRSQRAELRLAMDEVGSPFAGAADGHQWTEFTISVQNKGAKAVRDYYWQIFVLADVHQQVRFEIADGTTAKRTSPSMITTLTTRMAIVNQSSIERPPAVLSLRSTQNDGLRWVRSSYEMTLLRKPVCSGVSIARMERSLNRMVWVMLALLTIQHHRSIDAMWTTSCR
jgi:hypothetical protein